MRTWRTGLLICLLFVRGSGRARGQVVVKVDEDVNFRLGVLLQGRADWTQDPVSEGYSQNFFLRRVRFGLAATLGPNVSTFFQTDSPRLGDAGLTGTKISSTGFLVQDALLEWKLAGEAAMLDAGLLYTPQSRGGLTGSATYLSLDGPAFGQLQSALTGSSSGRDVGFAVKGYVARDRLEYRAGVFSGQRQSQAGGSAGSRNSIRAAGRLQYDFFDTEKGYAYTGTYRGTKKILAAGAWGETQGDFQAWGADAAADIPLGKDAATIEADYISYDGGRQFQQTAGNVVTPLLPEQKSFFTNAGWYFDALRLQPFVRYERLDFHDERFEASGQQRFGGGVNWYVAGQNLKATAAYERIIPKVKPAAATTKDTHHFVVQLQFYYF